MVVSSEWETQVPCNSFYYKSRRDGNNTKSKCERENLQTRMTTTKKWRGGGKELSLANSKTLKFFNVRFPTCSHSYVYFDIAMDMKSLWCPFLWELLGAWGVLVMSFYWKIYETQIFVFKYLFKLTNGPNTAFLHEWFTYLHKNTFSRRREKERFLCALYFFALIRNSFISPSSSSSLCCSTTQQKKSKEEVEGKVLRNFHSLFFRWK